MKKLIQTEELFILMALLYIYHLIPGSWPLFALCFFLPDLSIAAYLAGNRVGAIIYNTVHHRGTGVMITLGGLLIDQHYMVTAGIILLSHTTFDRVFGYGLKTFGGFKQTHLGIIGK